MDDTIAVSMEDLEKKYCPPLDPALFAAIALDFDLSKPDELEQLCDTLDALQTSAAEQENLPFDPSGTSGLDCHGDIDGVLSEPGVSNSGTLRSLETDITSLESNISSLGLNQNGDSPQDRAAGKKKTPTLRMECLEGGRVIAVAGLDTEGKIAYLKEMFPFIDDYTVTHTLKKCEEDIDRSMDVLLNLAFFEEQDLQSGDDKVAIPKGIEGFTENTKTSRGRRKGKGKRVKNQDVLRYSDSSSPSSYSDAVAENKWDTGKKDVDYICSRTTLTHQSVFSAYHLNGGSVATTLHSLASAEGEKVSDEAMQDSVMTAQVAELRQDFSQIPPRKLAGLLVLSRNSISAANELAQVMVTRPPTVAPQDLIQIVAPPPLASDATALPAKKSATKMSSSRTSNIDHNVARRIAQPHLDSGHTAFSKASAAYQRGKSDHLMGGAAAYYSAIGRDHVEAAKREAAAAADALVDTQSSATMLDLHGVTVQNAVRIADERVSAWWESLGDAKYLSGGGGPAKEGFRIVTGLGRHSKDGTSRIGPAVARTLTREGWRIEIGHGVLTVTGVARRR